MAVDKVNKDYMFGYDYRASARLDLQHFLIKQQIGHLLHPNIQLPETNAMIADIGAGTCIWPVEVAPQLHSTTHFDCFDITSAQFPHQDWLPSNVFLHLHDAFEPFPARFHGKYDLVNIRMFMCIVKDDDPSTLIETLSALLKPGGFVQWVDADPDSLRLIRPHESGKSSEAVEKMYDLMATPRPHLQYGWIPTLDAHLVRGGLTEVHLEKHAISPHLESFHNRLKLLTCEEAISLMPNLTSEELQQLRKMLGESFLEMRKNGAGLTTGFVLALGMKPK